MRIVSVIEADWEKSDLRVTLYYILQRFEFSAPSLFCMKCAKFTFPVQQVGS